ncbi:MAG: hypothetical protein UZ20_WS6002000840 [candidate division WS6 bacterium OLB21]|uniref:Uncharacterized protein n=1 Tax=candidate division WS6 bacterium OLB21 TaxID=1617427 RepID=A0A136KFY8_9BACT|nr:MAG: hypothetical protein UZ20_WS6002000840 [candidate division WS6 bacterium OLB21]
MKDRQKSLIILMLLTGVIGLVTTIIGLSLQNNSTAPQIVSATCLKVRLDAVETILDYV